MAGPCSWVGGIVLCVLSSLLLFLCFCWFPVSCSSQLVFEFFYCGPRAGVDSGPLPVSFVVSSSLPGWMPMHDSAMSLCLSPDTLHVYDCVSAGPSGRAA